MMTIMSWAFQFDILILDDAYIKGDTVPDAVVRGEQLTPETRTGAFEIIRSKPNQRPSPKPMSLAELVDLIKHQVKYQDTELHQPHPPTYTPTYPPTYPPTPPSNLPSNLYPPTYLQPVPSNLTRWNAKTPHRIQPYLSSRRGLATTSSSSLTTPP